MLVDVVLRRTSTPISIGILRCFEPLPLNSFLEVHADFELPESPIPAGPEPGRGLARQTGSCEESGNVEMSNSHILGSLGSEKSTLIWQLKMLFGSIWTHLALKPSQKSRPKLPVGGKQVRIVRI